MNSSVTVFSFALILQRMPSAGENSGIKADFVEIICKFKVSRVPGDFMNDGFSPHRIGMESAPE
jgi:hypothetical protein